MPTPARTSSSTPEGEPTDQHYLDRVRAGDLEAYSSLFERHYRDAVRISGSFVTSGMAEELVAEAFARILDQLRAGRGPSSAFRGYLLASVRNLHIDHVRRLQRTRPVEDVSVLVTHEEHPDPWEERFASSEAADAFRELPERWKQVLWLHVVEKRPLGEVAEILGTTPNSAAQLSFRAREALRINYLAAHAPRMPEPGCRAVVASLPRYVRGVGDRRKVGEHLPGCPSCTDANATLVELSRRLPGGNVPGPGSTP